ncbi:response regulator [Haliangium sp. UPWRP_2]|uniref:response regulator n=1 Tax=Haliangium sp. UPWRP_2 TaxID=1931276 RepID=UPI000D0DD278|nr:response regulator [Haliangium sp. UPWRP_2]PSM32043.1 hypothetical protein BVG81_002295 [Haliangium sp. UPWRP_2]HNN90762.1 response regulator [Pseudomonadota bacterium]
MHALKTPRKRRLVDVSADPKGRAFVQGKWMTLRVLKMGRASLFLGTQDYIPVRAFFELSLELARGTTPLRMLATVSYVERSGDGFGIGVEISSMATADQCRWSQFLDTVPAVGAVTADTGSKLRPVSHAGGGAVVVVAGALSARAIDQLQAEGLAVQSVTNNAEAIKHVRSGNVAMVVAPLHSLTAPGLMLCEQLRREHPRVVTVLHTQREQVADYGRGIQAGAALVIGTPCSQGLLLTRVLDVYHRALNRDSVFELSPAVEHGRAIAPGNQQASLLSQLWSWAFGGLQGTRQALGVEQAH